MRISELLGSRSKTRFLGEKRPRKNTAPGQGNTMAVKDSGSGSGSGRGSGPAGSWLLTTGCLLPAHWMLASWLLAPGCCLLAAG